MVSEVFSVFQDVLEGVLGTIQKVSGSFKWFQDVSGEF